MTEVSVHAVLLRSEEIPPTKRATLKFSSVIIENNIKRDNDMKFQKSCLICRKCQEKQQNGAMTSDIIGKKIWGEIFHVFRSTYNHHTK